MSSNQSFFPSFARKLYHHQQKNKYNYQPGKSLPLRVSTSPRTHKVSEYTKKQSSIPILFNDHYERPNGKELLDEGVILINHQQRSLQQIQHSNKNSKKIDRIKALGLNRSLQKKNKKFKNLFTDRKESDIKNLSLKMKNKLNKAKKKVHTTPNEPEIDQIYFETLKRKKIQQFWSRIPQKYNKQQGYEVRGQQLTKLTFLPLSTKRQKWNKTRKDTTMLQLGREKKVYENPEVKSRLEPWLQFNDDVITPFLI